MMRRVLNQVANAAVRSEGSVFQAVYRRIVPRLGHNKAIWAIAHRLCRLTWKILHRGVRYVEYGNRPNPKAVKTRMKKLVRELQFARLSSANWSTAGPDNALMDVSAQ